MTPHHTFNQDRLKVRVYNSRAKMGLAAAADVATALRTLLDEQPLVNMVFAAAPSQQEMLAALTQYTTLDWNRVNAFHMDEYIGLSEKAPQRFAYFLEQAIFNHLPFHAVHLIDGNAHDPVQECNRYADLLQAHPTDLVCMGIGENTHIAFNDPYVADFDDPLMVKMVELDSFSLQQQVNDGCFSTLADVPKQAITLTVPALFKADQVFCVVPGPRKSSAVLHTLVQGIGPAYPSTVLRIHQNATLYLDGDSAAQIDSSTR